EATGASRKKGIARPSPRIRNRDRKTCQVTRTDSPNRVGHLRVSDFSTQADLLGRRAPPVTAESGRKATPGRRRSMPAAPLAHVAADARDTAPAVTSAAAHLAEAAAALAAAAAALAAAPPVILAPVREEPDRIVGVAEAAE